MGMEGKTKPNENADMTVSEHIDELRSRLIKSIVALLVVAVVAFIFKGFVLDIIFAPMKPDFITNRLFCRLAALTGVDALCINQSPVDIINTKMAGQFNLHIKSSFIFGLIVAIPFILWQLWLFVKPALTPEVQMQSRKIVWYATGCFFIGLAFGYVMIAPLSINFLVNYNVSSSIANMIEVSSYLSLVLGVSLAAAVIFQLPLIVRILSTIGLLQSSLMRKYRRVSIALIVIIAAIITPPDVFSQMLVAIPLYGLYEYGILIAERIEKKRAKEE